MDVSSPSLPSKTLKQRASAQVTCIAFEETSVLPEAELINSQHLFLTRAHVRHISCSRRWAPSAACIRSRAAAGRRFVAAACGQHDPHALQPESRQRRRLGLAWACLTSGATLLAPSDQLLQKLCVSRCHGPGLPSRKTWRPLPAWKPGTLGQGLCLPCACRSAAAYNATCCQNMAAAHSCFLVARSSICMPYI